jgi:hypothetical protein
MQLEEGDKGRVTTRERVARDERGLSRIAKEER